MKRTKRPAPRARRRRGTRRYDRRGMVLILVLIVIALLSLAAYSFATLMFAEREGAIVHGRQLQSRALADSGVAFIRQRLSRPAADLADEGGLYDNPNAFRGVLVKDDAVPRDRGRFTVLATGLQDGRPAGIRYGLEDESCRLNVNLLPVLEDRIPGSARTLLMALPGMTEDTADAIIDWLDEDEIQLEYGAESDYYSSVDPPYAAKNGPLHSLDELLRVRGVTAGLLYGADADRNSLVDPDVISDTVEDIDNSDGSLDLGWSSYLTVYSAESNLRPDGTPKINLNASDLEKLHEDLKAIEGFEEDWATFIVAYRQFGPLQQPGAENSGGNQAAGGQGGGSGQTGGGQSGGQSGGSRGGGNQGGGGQGGGAGSGNSGAGGNAAPSTPTPLVRLPGEAVGGRQVDFNTPGGTQLTTILDIIGEQVQVTFSGATQPVIVESPFGALPGMMEGYIDLLMENTTINPAPMIPGRINVNQASRAILLGIPDMTPDLVDRIISVRDYEPTDDDPNRRYEAWLMTEGLVTLGEMKDLMPYVTAKGSVYRAQVVGYFDAPGPASRLEVVIDATTPAPRLLFWKDLGALGAGHPLETLGLGAAE